MNRPEITICIQSSLDGIVLPVSVFENQRDLLRRLDKNHLLIDYSDFSSLQKIVEGQRNLNLILYDGGNKLTGKDIELLCLNVNKLSIICTTLNCPAIDKLPKESNLEVFLCLSGVDMNHLLFVMKKMAGIKIITYLADSTIVINAFQFIDTLQILYYSSFMGNKITDTTKLDTLDKVTKTLKLSLVDLKPIESLSFMAKYRVISNEPELTKNYKLTPFSEDLLQKFSPNSSTPINYGEYLQLSEMLEGTLYLRSKKFLRDKKLNIFK